MVRRWTIGEAAVLLVSLVFGALPLGAASVFADPAFATQWRADEGITSDVWGPLSTAQEGMQEPYKEANGGTRLVQYFDKGRMELTDGAVSNGLLAADLVKGQIQVGDGIYQPLPPPSIPIAGDVDNPGPTYAGLSARGRILFAAAAPVPPSSRFASTLVTTRVAVDGTPSNEPSASPNTGEGQTALAAYDLATRHNLPQAFVEYRRRVGIATIGLALCEPFLTTVKVGGTQREVMVEVFERRVLTYTAANPSGFTIEMGNIGQHYYQWRYRSAFAIADADPRGFLSPLVERQEAVVR